MIRVPKFKSHLRVKVMPPDLVFFLNESGHQLLQGELTCLLAPFINGVNTVSDIVKQMNGRINASDVECGILLLEAEGCIVDARDALSGLEVLRDSLNIDAKVFARRLKQTRIRVLSFGDVPTALFVSILKSLELSVADEADFTVTLVDDYLCHDLEKFNQKAIRHQWPWMMVKPAGSSFWLGPVFRQGTACWGCLARRLKENRRVEAFLELQGGSEDVSPRDTPFLGSFLDAALNLAAIEVLKNVVTGSGPTSPLTLLTFDAREMKLQKHAVMRLDDCPYCRLSVQRSKRSSARIVLKSCKKPFLFEGGRSTSAETSFEKYEHHISPLTGIVDQVKPAYDHANGLVHSCVAGHLFVARSQKQDLLHKGLVQKSFGKGTTRQQAKTGALCEALERYSGVFRGGEFRVARTYSEFTDRVIHPNACMNFSEKQYEERDQWNASHSNHDWVPMRFNEDREIDWTPVWSLTQSKTKYVPTAYCFYGYRLAPDHQFCRADSNGNAAGNTLEESILHGFMELVERDCIALWWFNRIRRAAIYFESFSLPYCAALHDYYQALGRDFWVLDISSDFDIPCFAAISAPKRTICRDLLLGFGAHFDPKIALLRALTEMNQFLPNLLSGRSTRMKWRRGADLAFLYPDTSKPCKNLGDFRCYESDDFREDVMTCVKIAESRGMETLVLNQTRPDVGIPVAKVIVPGMRQLWARFGKGRLYEVPVQMGWLKEPLSEEQLNHDSFFV